MERHRNSQRGQIMLLMAIALVVLLAFAALAIDGSMVYYDRRTAQTAADAAALAGASAAGQALETMRVDASRMLCDSTSVINAMGSASTAAVGRAASNQFTISSTLTGDHGVAVTCNSVVTGGFVDRYIEVRVLITSVTQTAFAQVVFPEGLKNTVEAVARLRPRRPISYGYAIVSLNPECTGEANNGIELDGTSTVTVVGAGIYSNSCLSANGNKLVVRAIPDTDGDLDTGGIHYVRTYKPSGSPTLLPIPAQEPASLPGENVTPPTCSANGSMTTAGGVDTYSPGNYPSGIHLGSHSTVVFSPGIYCLGDDLDNSGSVNVTGNGVVFSISPGDFNLTGSGDIYFTPPTTGTYKGMLMLVASGNVKMEGSTTSSYAGTVYAPNGQVDVGGNNNSTTPTSFGTQIVGRTVKVHGNASMDIVFNSDAIFQIPPKLELFK